MFELNKMLNNDKINSMDPQLLFSLLNMKLRNDFTSLARLCVYYQLTQALVEEKLAQAGFYYQISLNQFKTC